MKISEIQEFIINLQNKINNKSLKFKINVYNPRCTKANPIELYSLEMKFDILIALNKDWNNTIQGYIDIYFNNPRIIKISLGETIYKSNHLSQKKSIINTAVDGLKYIVENHISLVTDDTVNTR